MATHARARHVFHAFALVIGAGALAVLVHQLGVEGLERVVIGTGWYFLALAAIDLASVLCDAAGVHSFVRRQAPVSYWRVFAAQASGLAINRLTPGNSMGEPVKVTMLVEHVPATAAVSAIVLFNLATYAVAIATIVLGVPLTLVAIDLPGRAQLLVWGVTAVLVGLALAIVALARRGALGTLVDVARRGRLVSAARAGTWQAKVAAIDAQVRQLGRPGSWRGGAFVLASRLLNSLGTIVVMVAADVPLTAPLVLAMLSIGIVITWLSNVVPLGLGVADGSNYALYGALGSTGAAGLVFTMINRARTCVLALMGLTVMLVANVADRAVATPET